MNDLVIDTCGLRFTNSFHAVIAMLLNEQFLAKLRWCSNINMVYKK